MVESDPKVLLTLVAVATKFSQKHFFRHEMCTYYSAYAVTPQEVYCARYEARDSDFMRFMYKDDVADMHSQTMRNVMKRFQPALDKGMSPYWWPRSY